MTLKPKLYGIPVLLTSVSLGILILSGHAASQSPSLGKNFDEIVKLAAKEGRGTDREWLDRGGGPFCAKRFQSKVPDDQS